MDAASAGDLPLMRVLITRFGADVFVADPANGVTLLHTGAKPVFDSLYHTFVCIAVSYSLDEQSCILDSDLM